MRRWEVVALIGILVVATALRTWRLDSVPPGLTHDEASNGHDAAAVLRGVRPIYFTVGYGHEPLYPYSVALLMALLGPTTMALRLTTVGWGLVVILLSYALARCLFDPLSALLTAAWMALSFWCVMTSRVGLRAITSAATFSASAFSFWRAFYLSGNEPSERRGRAWLWWGLSGVFLGASIYTYMASRAMPAVYLLFCGYLSVLHVVGGQSPARAGADPAPRGEGAEREPAPRGMTFDVPASVETGTSETRANASLRRRWMGTLLLLLVAALVASPLVHYLITHPEAEQRIDQLSAPLRQALRGSFGDLWRRLGDSLPMFTFRGDPLWLYNIPGRPLLDVAGAFFYAGLLVCLWRWRDPRYAFLVLWLIVGIGPAAVTGPDATTLRSIAAQPAVFITASLGVSTVTRFFYRRAGRLGRIATAGAVMTLLVMTSARTAHAYFRVWAQHRDVRVAYHHALVEEAHYLDAQPEDGIVLLSSIYPGRFHDPYTMEISLQREDLSLRWFDGRSALVIPDAGQSRVIVPSIAPLDEALEPVLERHGTLVHSQHFRPDDLVTHFDVYRFDGERAVSALLPTVKDVPVSWSPSDTFPTDDPQSVYRPLTLPVNVGDVVDLVGYDLRTPTLEPGEAMELVTVWRIRDTFPGEAVAFTHVLNHEGQVVGQLDRLDAPSWHWRSGDYFLQLHRFAIGGETPPGVYPVEVGMYVREGPRRLPILVDGESVDDRILLRPLDVAEP